MKKWPKYKTLPLALLLYFVVMAALGIKQNHGILPNNFWISVVVELLVIVALYWLLKKKSKAGH